MMHRAHQRVQQQRQYSSTPRWRHDLFQKICIALEEFKPVLSCGVDFIEITRNFVRCRQRFGKRPFEWIVPQIACDTAKRLFYARRAAQNVLASGKPDIGSARRFTIKQFGRNPTNQFARAAMKLNELPIETLDQFVHLIFDLSSLILGPCPKTQGQRPKTNFLSIRFGAPMLFSHAEAVVLATIL